MRRRDVIAGLAGLAGSWPLAAVGQPAAVPRIGFLSSASPASYGKMLAQFRAGLQEAGVVEPQNVTIELRWADNRYDRLPALVAELVRIPVAVLVANGPAVPVAKAATSTIPIVFTAGLDPIELGLVRSLNRPGENVTGISVLNVELAPKRVELIREMLPKAKTLGLLINPNNPNMASVSRSTQSATRTLGLALHIEQASRDADIEPAVEKLRSQGADVLVIGTDPFFTTLQERLAGLAARHALPAIYQYREFAAAGGLMSYGGDLPAAYRRAGVYTARILKGENAGDLPVEQVSKVELVINLKAARALGLTMSQSLLARADEVIE